MVVSNPSIRPSQPAYAFGKNPISKTNPAIGFSASADIFQRSISPQNTHPTARFAGSDSPQKLADELNRPLSAGLSESARVRKVADFAKRLFQECSTESELLEFLQHTGTYVCNAKDHKWVKSGIEALGSNALFYTPPSILNLPEDTKKRDLGMPKEVDDLCKSAQANKFSFMLYDSTPDPTDPNAVRPINHLRHEAYHLIQVKMGLPQITANHDHNQLALQYINQLLEHLTDTQTAAETQQRIQSALTKAAQYKKPSNPQAGSVGEAMAINGKREKEVYDFFCDQYPALGLNQAELNYNLLRKELYRIAIEYSHCYNGVR